MSNISNLIVILSLCCVVAIAAPYQELAPKAGYVPVYIREGNTPLSEIHPKLVEAFHEDETPSAKLQIEAIKPEEVNDKEEEINDEINKSSNQAENSDESIEDESAKVEETTDTDIAEFNNDDDLKQFAGDKAEN